MKVEIKGKELVITLPYDEKGTPSKSGKSTLHATTNGNQSAGVKVGDKDLVVSVNAYTAAK